MWCRSKVSKNCEFLRTSETCLLIFWFARFARKSHFKSHVSPVSFSISRAFSFPTEWFSTLAEHHWHLRWTLMAMCGSCNQDKSLLPQSCESSRAASSTVVKVLRRSFFHNWASSALKLYGQASNNTKTWATQTFTHTYLILRIPILFSDGQMHRFPTFYCPFYFLQLASEASSVFQNMFAQRNRNFLDFLHNKIAQNRKIGKTLW